MTELRIQTATIVREPSVGSGAGGSVYCFAAATVDPGGVISDAVYQDANDNVLQSFTSSEDTVELSIRSAYPQVRVNGGPQQSLPLVGDVFSGTVEVTLTAGPANDLVIETFSADGSLGAQATVEATLDAAPELLTLEFAGGYPGSQTELKAGDTFELTGTTNKAADAIQLADSGAGNGALITFASGTSFTVTVTIPDRGDTLTVADLQAQARDSVSGALGPSRSTNEDSAGVDGVNTVRLNNVAPTVSFGAITYPAMQGALKGSESADVVFSTNGDSVAFSSPTSELSIAGPTTIATPKTVTRIAGSTNESTPNLQAVATRAANGQTATATAVVFIQNVAPTIDLSLPAARLRSGGNNGTSAQDYTLTLSSNQQLASAPTLLTDQGGDRGSFTGAFTGGPSTWTRTIRVDEGVPDEKGDFAFEGLSATNLAGLQQTSIGSGAGYTLGGFVARTLTFAAFATETQIGTEVSDFSKLQAGIFTASGNQSVKQPIGTSPPVVEGYTVDAVDQNPTDLIWLDTVRAATNSSGTAAIEDVEEVV